jgi:peptidoglycan/LPS O-acetylase OafA/YrhL/lysophospholipase L1-like esterase
MKIAKKYNVYTVKVICRKVVNCLQSIHTTKQNMLDSPTVLKHIPGLDGLRAIAVIGVVLYHMFPYSIRGGYLGVSLFFVISGYLITMTFENSLKNNKYGVMLYYKKRLYRIYPPLIIMAFTTLGLLKILSLELIADNKQELISILFGYNNWWQILQNASYFTKINNTSPFTHLWSLSIELQYYILYPFLFLFYRYMKRSKLKNWAAYIFLILAFVSVFRMQALYQPNEDASRVYYGTDTRVYSLLFGTFLAILQKYIPKYRLSYTNKKRLVYMFYIFMIILLLSFIYMDGESAMTYRAGMLVMSLLFCGIIALVSNSHLSIGKRLDSTLLSWIGQRSYEIYLWQYPVIFLFNYNNWNKSIFSIWIQVFVILILSSWLHFVVTIKRYNFGGKKMKHITRKSFLAIISIALFTLCLEGCSAVMTSVNKRNDQVNLEKELKQGTIELEKQEAGNSEKNVKNGNGSSEIITAIGDSVMLGAAPSIKEILPKCMIDAKESRQVTKAKEIVDNLSNEGNLGNTVIIALGTNGPFSESKGQELIDQIGKDKAIYWVTVYGKKLQWQEKTNSTIRDLAENNENVFIVDWENAAELHPEWLYNDGIHLNAEGQAAYANIIIKSLSQK